MVDARGQRLASSIVLRVSASLYTEMSTADSEQARCDLLQRVPLLPLQLLTFADGDLQLATLIAEGLRVEEPAAIAAVRQADLCGLVKDHEDVCHYRSNPHHHYVAPSDRHCSAFFRLGDAIRSREALERLAFWILPTVLTSDALLVDTWSIASVALRALHLQGRQIPFDCLANHPQQDRQDAEKIVRRLVREMKPGGRLCAIISVTSSGRFANIIAEIAKRTGCSDVRCVALYRLTTVSEEVEALCQLGLDPNNFPAAACDLCDRGSAPIRLHPGLYYLKEFPETTVTLGKNHFPPRSTTTPVVLSDSDVATGADTGGSFSTRYGSTSGLYSVHRNDREGNHHAFHVNVDPLLAQKVFQERYFAEIDRLKHTPDLVITPPDNVSIAMGTLAAERLGCPRISVSSLRTRLSLSSSDVRLLDQAKHFLILDDVVVSGSRLMAYNDGLRRAERQPESVHYLVALARTKADSEWQKLRGSLTKHVPWHAGLSAVEEFFLPEWPVRSCPWCREYEFLAETAKELPELPNWLESRLSLLTERERGIRDEPLFLLPGVPARTLGSGSLVGPAGASAMDTLFSFASALQALRHDESGKRLHPHFPEFRVFDVRNLRNYSEGLLRAIILRTVLPIEWGYTLQPKELCTALLAAARDDDQDVILGEMLLAVVRGSVDRSITSEVVPILHSKFGDSLGVLLRALRKR